MSVKFLDYLRREHARLAGQLEAASTAQFPDELELTRLKKLKLAVKDQILEIEAGWPQVA